MRLTEKYAVVPGQQEPSHEKFNEFLNAYYKPGSPEEALKSLTYYLSEGCDLFPAESIPLVVYFFARIAQAEPQIIRLYEK